MAKKKQDKAADTAKDASTKGNPEQKLAVVAPDVARVRAAFEAGNFSMVRQMGSASTSSEAVRAEVASFMPRMNIETQQLLVGVAALAVVLTAAALSLVSS